MNKKMQKMLRGNPYVSTALSVAASVLAVSGIVYAATTIGTNVSIDGTLTQTGIATFTDSVRASSTLLVTGAVTHYGASTFGDAATDVNLFTGTVQASTTALFTTGVLTYGNSTFGDASTDTNLFTGTVQASTTALFTNGLTAYATATLTGVKVGGGGTTFTQLVAGFCNIPDTTVAASTTAYADCTSATGIAANDRVFVMATGSLAASVVVKGATSTADNTINVALQNVFNVSTTTGNISFNFWAFK